MALKDCCVKAHVIKTKLTKKRTFPKLVKYIHPITKEVRFARKLKNGFTLVYDKNKVYLGRYR